MTRVSDGGPAFFPLLSFLGIRIIRFFLENSIFRVLGFYELIVKSKSETQSDLFEEGALPPQTNKLGITSESTLPPVLRAFEQHMREEGFAKNTIKAFASDVRLLHSFLTDQPINEIGTADLNNFMNWLVYEISQLPSHYFPLSVLRFSLIQDTG